MVIKVLAPGYFARQDTKTPVSVGIKALVVNMVLNLALIIPLAHVGLALATSLSAALNAALLYLGLRKEGVYQPQAGWAIYLLRLAAAAGLMIALILWMDRDVSEWLSWGWEERVWQLAQVVVLGLLSYVGTLLILGMRPRDLLTKPGID